MGRIGRGEHSLVENCVRAIIDLKIMAFGVSDDLLLIFVPIIVFWLYSGIYMMLGSLENYRLHSKKDEDEKNSASKGDVVKLVLFQQALQAASIFYMTRNNADTPSQEHSLIVVAVQYVVGIVVVDTWQYFAHRFILHNKYLYNYIHSQHHRLVVPYAFGALYSHPAEGVLLDTIGATLSFLISGMSTRAAIFFFCFVSMKNVDDHCGLILPWNPFHLFFTNTTAYHDIHHQLYGTKYNFAQPFFVTWDKILGTHMPYTLEKKEGGGGFETRILKNHKGM